MKKNIIAFMLLLVTSLTLNAAVSSVNNEDIYEDIRKVSYLTQVADEINKTLPTQIDKITRLEHVQAFYAMLSYNYTIIGFDKLKVSNERIKEILKPKNVNVICTTPALKIFPKSGIDIKFNYYKENGVFINSFVIKRKDCKNLK